MAANKVEDLAIRKESLNLLKDHQERIQEIFQVEIASGFLSDDGTQWLEIGGKENNVKEANEYIKALCSPAEKLEMEYSKELHALLSNNSVHRKLEKQSNAVIIFPTPGILTIMGSDTLSVTLALSAVEELINKYLNQGTTSAAGQLSPSTNLSSQRLNDELRRLSTEKQGIMLEDDYYSNANDAVKRTILSWMNDDSILQHDEDIRGSPHQKIEVSCNEQAGESAYNSSVLQQNFLASKLNTSPIKGSANVQVYGNDQIISTTVKRTPSKSDIELLPPETFVKTKQVMSGATVKVPSVSLPQPIIPVTTINSTAGFSNQSVVTQSHSIITDEIPTKDCLLAYGLQFGVTEEIIELVFKKYGTNLTKLDLVKHAMNVKSEQGLAKAKQAPIWKGDSNSHDTVIDLTLDGPHTNGCPSFSKSGESTSSKKYEDNVLQRKDDFEGEDYLLALGLQQDFSEEDIEQVFKKYGKRLTKPDFLQYAFDVRSDKERAKVYPKPKSSFPKAPTVEELSMNKTLQPEILKNKEHMDHYFSQLSKDFTEEENCGVDELKMRNFERQRLLREAYEKASSDQVMKEENWDEGMDVGVENKKRKHKNTEKGAGPRKSRYSPVDEKSCASFPQKAKGTKSRQNRWSPANEVPCSSKSRESTPLDKNKSSINNNWSPSDDKTSFGNLFISKDSKSGYDPNYFRAVDQSNPFNHGNKGLLKESDHGSSKTYTRERTTRSPSPKGAVAKNRACSQSPQNVGSKSNTYSGYDTAPGMPAPTIHLRSNLRYIVIDGSNVAFHHGNHHVFSCKGIEIVVNYFLNRGHTEVTAFVPQWRTRTVQNTPIEDQHLLEDLRKKGYLVYTPARKIGAKTIKSHDDNFVLRLAVETDGIVVTNDNFRDHYQDRPDWRDVIENRLLMYSFVGNFFMPPEDPMGPHGPNLDEFLRKGNVIPRPFSCRDEGQKEGRQRERPHSSSPKLDYHSQPFNITTSHQHFLNDNKLKPHQGPQPLMSITASHPATQQAWMHQGKGGQMAWQQVVPKGRTEIHGTKKGTPVPIAGKGQFPQTSKNLTWQQEQMMNEKLQNSNRQQQQNRQSNKRINNAPSTSTGPPLRTDDQTLKLFNELKEIFPDELVKIQRILENHPRETDIQKLSIHLLDIISD